MKDWLVLTTAVVLTGAGGFLIGRLQSDGKGPDASETKRPMGVRNVSLVGGEVSSRSAGRSAEAVRERTAAREARAVYLSMDLERDLQSVIKGANNPVERFASLSRMLEHLDAKSLPAVLEAFKEIPMTADHQDEYQMLLFAWAKFDREGAFRFIEDFASSGAIQRDQLVQPVLAAWAGEDPKQALAWFETLPSEQQTHALKKGLINGWATHDAYGAAEYLQTQKADQFREYLAGDISAYMFKQGVSEATHWAESLTDHKLKEQAFEELAEDWVSLDPPALANWLSKFVNESYSVEAFEDLGRGWVSTDPDAATEWFAQLPDGRAKEMGIFKMARTWADNDLPALGEWLNSLPDSRTTDLGVRAYAERLVNQAPEAAVESAMSIVDDGMRDQTVQALAQQWYGRDQEAAIAWADANQYPVEQLMSDEDVYALINSQQLKQITRMVDEGKLSETQMENMLKAQEQLARQQQAEGPLQGQIEVQETGAGIGAGAGTFDLPPAPPQG